LHVLFTQRGSSCATAVDLRLLLSRAAVAAAVLLLLLLLLLLLSLQVRDSDEYNSENKGDFEEIDVEFLNADPGVPNSVWFNSYHRYGWA
jgi:hypothetical protein